MNKLCKLSIWVYVFMVMHRSITIPTRVYRFRYAQTYVHICIFMRVLEGSTYFLSLIIV